MKSPVLFRNLIPANLKEKSLNSLDYEYTTLSFNAEEEKVFSKVQVIFISYNFFLCVQRISSV